MGTLIAVIIVVVFISIFFIWAKKDKERLDGFVSSLSTEQKEKLANTEIQAVEGEKNAWVQDGLICKVNVKNENKVALVVLWYNKLIQNDTFNQIQHADINMKKAIFDEHKLKEGDFVKIYIDPEKSAKIIFE